MPSRVEQAREVLRSTAAGVEWASAFETESFSPELLALQRASIDAWSRGDVDWIYEHADPTLEIRQPSELPDARAYHGREGVLDAILDWPVQWEDFKLTPRRIFAIDSEYVVTVALHRGRPRQLDLEVEAEIAWLFRWRDGRLVRWDMFMNIDDAVRAAGAD